MSPLRSHQRAVLEAELSFAAALQEKAVKAVRFAERGMYEHVNAVAFTAVAKAHKWQSECDAGLEIAVLRLRLFDLEVAEEAEEPPTVTGMREIVLIRDRLEALQAIEECAA